VSTGTTWGKGGRIKKLCRDKKREKRVWGRAKGEGTPEEMLEWGNRGEFASDDLSEGRRQGVGSSLDFGKKALTLSEMLDTLTLIIYVSLINVYVIRFVSHKISLYDVHPHHSQSNLLTSPISQPSSSHCPSSTS